MPNMPKKKKHQKTTALSYKPQAHDVLPIALCQIKNSEPKHGKDTTLTSNRF